MATAQSVIAQHARTASLLGPGFVPVSSGSPRALSGAPAAPTTATAPTDRAARQAALDALRARYESDAPHSAFVTAHTKIVFADGDPGARLMFVGEAPGADEDRIGIPFVGRAGQLLNKMIEAMGLRREDVYICNVLKTRPPGNATPTLDESRLCAPYLFGQIGIVRPEVIVTLGLPAARVLLNSSETMGRMRGRWAEFIIPDGVDEAIIPGDSVGIAIPVMPTFHPAYLLRQYTTENRQKVWSDLCQVIQRLGLPVPQKNG
ncbi:MAG: uracil-DNA glycosylase [Phycisphaeraceae bacterium]|nr:uracil-DNA glycosylase [Phycisphaeraceae bacterium]